VVNICLASLLNTTQEDFRALTDEDKRRIFEEEKLKKEMQGKSVGVSVCLLSGCMDLWAHIRMAFRKQIWEKAALKS